MKVMALLPYVLACDAVDFGVAKRKAIPTELQSVKRGAHTHTQCLENPS